MKRISCFVGAVIILVFIASSSVNVTLANEESEPVCEVCGKSFVDSMAPHTKNVIEGNEEKTIIFCSQECTDEYEKGLQENAKDEEEDEEGSENMRKDVKH